jgi:hypothetical protein
MGNKHPASAAPENGIAEAAPVQKAKSRDLSADAVSNYGAARSLLYGALLTFAIIAYHLSGRFEVPLAVLVVMSFAEVVRLCRVRTPQ